MKLGEGLLGTEEGMEERKSKMRGRTNTNGYNLPVSGPSHHRVHAQCPSIAIKRLIRTTTKKSPSTLANCYLFCEKLGKEFEGS